MAEKKEAHRLLIHIIVHNKSNPIEAYFDKDKAYERYKGLRWEQPGYGVMSLDIKDAPQPSIDKRNEDLCQLRKPRPSTPGY